MAKTPQGDETAVMLLPRKFHPKKGKHGTGKGRGKRTGGTGKGKGSHQGSHRVGGALGASHTAGRAFVETAGAQAEGRASSPTALPHIPHASAAAGHGEGPIVLHDLGAGALSTPGLGDVLLELVGEGTLHLGHALAAWQREQERVSNRAWRRPGGLARMGGL